ncbi:MAG TPA: hypothetical protein VNO33_23340 [Kofleriaceae bacterium]|nr:hypothetical protein [Kofleriaceae bacterium]
MLTRPVLVASGLAFAALSTAAAAPAHAQYDVRGYVSTRGLDFIAEQVPSLVPTSIEAPEISQALACITATQRGTTVALDVQDFSLTIPEPGRLRLAIALSAEGSGELFIDNAIACFGELTCQDQITVTDARATIDFDVSLADGSPSVVFRSVDLQLSEDNIDIQFSGCAVGDIATSVIGFAKQFVFDFLVGKAEEIAVAELGPLVESMLGGLGTFSGAFAGPFGTYEVGASLEQILVEAGGIGIGASIDLSSPAEAAECVAEFDAGEPVTHEGEAMDLSADDSHVGLALNLGLAEDALYHVWRQGLTCITGDQLEALGIELPVDKILAIMPGFPPGTELEMEARLTQPPRVAGAGSSEDGVAMAVAVDGVEVILRGLLPDGSEREIQVGVDAEATAAVGVDPSSNALVATPGLVTLKRLEMDQVSVAETGFDVARLTEVVRDHMMPKLLKEMGTLPVTGPVFRAGPLPFAVILRGMANNDAYMSVHADLFRVPDEDPGAPETSIIDYPSGVVSPADAVVRVSGTDGLIPTELLQYQVSVGGEARAPSYIKSISIGEPGASGTYDVQVAAIDLAGNTDGTPASVQIEVDGIAPEVVVDGDRVRKMGEAEGEAANQTELTWRMSDDRTAPEDLAARIELFAVTDPEDLLATEHVRTIELDRGATSGSIEVDGGELYRAELYVVDAVGNETVSAILLDATRDEGGCGGCAAGRGGASGALPLLLALFGAYGLIGRRRRG